MPAKITSTNGNLITVKLSGKLQQPELASIQAASAKLIAELGHIRVLALLEDFQGWDNSGNWEDCSFQVENDSFIKKMAIVGDAKWKDQALMFTGQGFRPVGIEFFEPSQAPAAIRWLDAP